MITCNVSFIVILSTTGISSFRYQEAHKLHFFFQIMYFYWLPSRPLERNDGHGDNINLGYQSDKIINKLHLCELTDTRYLIYAKL